MAARKRRISPNDALDKADEARETDELELLRAQLSDARAEVRRLRKRASKHMVIEDAIVKAVTSYFDDVPPTVKSYKRSAPARKRKSLHEERPVLLIGDIQLGKVTKTYDSDIACERVHLAVDKALAIVEDRRQSANIPDVDLIFLGDQIENEAMFASQPFEIDSPAIDQIDKVATLQADVVSRLAANFDHVNVVCASGNHGRVASRHATQSFKTNFDRMSYRLTEARIGHLPSKDRERIDFLVMDHAMYVHDILGWRFLIMHGDTIRGGFAGLPTYGIVRKATQLKDVMEGSYDAMVLGHFHNKNTLTQNSTTIFVNGSPESDNEYARAELAAGNDPSQTLLFVTREHGVVADCQLWLTDRVPFQRRVAEERSR